MENENDNGAIVKIYKSQVDPILVGGRLRRPQTKMGISSGHMTLKLDTHPIFKITILRRENLFSPECRSKVVKF